MNFAEKKVTITKSEINFGANIAVPTYGLHYISTYLKIPYNLEFNKAYYAYNSTDNLLYSFKILAMALKNYGKCFGGYDIKFVYLLQYPNGDTKWTSLPSNIFHSKEMFLEHNMGNKNGVIDKCLLEIYKNGMPFELSLYRDIDKLKFNCGWYWCSSRQQPIQTNCIINSFVITKDNIFIELLNIDSSEHQLFNTKEDCASHKLNNTQIIEFADDTFNGFAIQIPQAKAEHKVLKIIEC